MDSRGIGLGVVLIAVERLGEFFPLYVNTLVHRAFGEAKCVGQLVHRVAADEIVSHCSSSVSDVLITSYISPVPSIVTDISGRLPSRSEKVVRRRRSELAITCFVNDTIHLFCAYPEAVRGKELIRLSRAILTSCIISRHITLSL